MINFQYHQVKLLHTDMVLRYHTLIIQSTYNTLTEQMVVCYSAIIKKTLKKAFENKFFAQNGELFAGNC